MEGLKTLIRNLAFILLLASFMEMLLPNKSMRGFVQLVMGLFVIAAILDPLAGLLSWDLEKEIPAWINGSTGDMPVIAADDDSREKANTIVREQYKKILVDQIEVLAAKIDGITDVEATVELEDEGGFTDYPKVKKVTIRFSRSTTSEPVKPVETVIIGEEQNYGSNQSDQSTKALEIKKQVAALMELPEDIIIVQENI